MFVMLKYPGNQSNPQILFLFLDITAENQGGTSCYNCCYAIQCIVSTHSVSFNMRIVPNFSKQSTKFKELFSTLPGFFLEEKFSDVMFIS
jgi:hypothetical protein